MPYNYLLQENIRNQSNINVSGSIVIFDEAHNIEKLAEDGSSFGVSLEKFRKVISQMERLAQLPKKRTIQTIIQAINPFLQKLEEIKKDLQDNLREKNEHEKRNHFKGRSDEKDFHEAFEGSKIFSFFQATSIPNKLEKIDISLDQPVYKSLFQMQEKQGLDETNFEDVMMLLGDLESEFKGNIFRK